MALDGGSGGFRPFSARPSRLIPPAGKIKKTTATKMNPAKLAQR
jgi:hypothetical protein